MKERQSNIELVRIVAMLLIVLVHANNYSLGPISKSDILLTPSSSFLRLFFEQVCLVGVNLFVLISGWFGIRPTIKGATSLLYQVFFYAILILLVGLAIGIPVPRSILKAFYFGGSYWFIPAYLILYVLAPVLNSFVDSSSEKELLAVIISFFVLEFAYGWVADMGSYEGGYSTISFVGLYLLARYVNKYSTALRQTSSLECFVYYLLLTILPTILAFFGLKYIGRDFYPSKYCSPFVVFASLFLFLSFQKLSFRSKFVNWIACSVFSVYLVHLNPMINTYFMDTMRSAYESLCGCSYCFFAIGFAMVLCLICPTLDKIRIISWNGICSLLLDRVFAGIDNQYSNLFARVKRQQ